MLGQRNPRSTTLGLRDLLRRESHELYGKFIAIQEQIELKFRNATTTFENSRGSEIHPAVLHIRAIQVNLAQLIGPDILNTLSVFEVFALLCAGVLHDAQVMIDETPGQGHLHLNRVDRFHRTRDYVVRNHRDLDLSMHEATIVGELCRAHGMPTLEYLESQSYSLRGFGEIRVPFISALLRMATVLDLAPTL